jgi:hypothetical protein
MTGYALTKWAAMSAKRTPVRCCGKRGREAVLVAWLGMCAFHAGAAQTVWSAQIPVDLAVGRHANRIPQPKRPLKRPKMANPRKRVLTPFLAPYKLGSAAGEWIGGLFSK